MTVYYLYVLLCPDTGKVRYVGKTYLPLFRELQHRYGYGNSPIDRWKRRLGAADKRVVFRIIEELSDSSQAKWREHWWIRYFRHQGQPILNVNTISAKTARELRNPRKRYKRRGNRERVNPADYFDLSVFIAAGDHLAI